MEMTKNFLVKRTFDGSETVAYVSVDNDREELKDFIDAKLAVVNFEPPMTVLDFWTKCGPGTFLLLTRSADPVSHVARCHVVVVRQGVIEGYDDELLQTPLIGIQEVVTN